MLWELLEHALDLPMRRWVEVRFDEVIPPLGDVLPTGGRSPMEGHFDPLTTRYVARKDQFHLFLYLFVASSL